MPLVTSPVFHRRPLVESCYWRGRERWPHIKENRQDYPQPKVLWIVETRCDMEWDHGRGWRMKDEGFCLLRTKFRVLVYAHVLLHLSGDPRQQTVPGKYESHGIGGTGLMKMARSIKGSAGFSPLLQPQTGRVPKARRPGRENDSSGRPADLDWTLCLISTTRGWVNREPCQVCLGPLNQNSLHLLSNSPHILLRNSTVWPLLSPFLWNCFCSSPG